MKAAVAAAIRQYSARHGRFSHDDLLKLLRPSIAQMVLDVGAGDGEFTRRVADAVEAKHIEAIDVMAGHEEALRGRGIMLWVCHLDETWPVRDASVDLLVASQVIEHVGDTDHFVRESFRVLRPGGYTLVATPNLAALYNIAFLLAGRQPPVTAVSDVVGASAAWDQVLLEGGHAIWDGNPRHRRVFTRESVHTLYQFYGFTVEAMAMSGFPLLPRPLSVLACKLLPIYGWNILLRCGKPD